MITDPISTIEGKFAKQKCGVLYDSVIENIKHDEVLFQLDVTKYDGEWEDNVRLKIISDKGQRYAY